MRTNLVRGRHSERNEESYKSFGVTAFIDRILPYAICDIPKRNTVIPRLDRGISRGYALLQEIIAILITKRAQTNSVFLTLCSLLLTLLTSCTPQYLSEEALAKYATDPDHGLVQEKRVNGIDLKVQYKPRDLLVAQETRRDNSEHARMEAALKYDNYEYFILELSSGNREVLYSGASPKNQFGELISTLAFRMDQYAYLATSEQDTIPVGDFVFPRTYGMGQSTQLMLVFNNDALGEDEWVDLHLNEFGIGTGQQRFRFETRDIDKIPKLKLLEN